MKKVVIIGLGYIGLPTAITSALYGYEVVGFDINEEKVTRINAQDPVIDEPSIKEKLERAYATGRLRATAVIEPADFFIIAVPTPFTHDKKADLSYVYQAAQAISHVLKKDDVIILESTVPVGTTQAIADALTKASHLTSEHDFFVTHCPERVLPGNIFHELIYNNRIVGGISQEGANKAKEFYSAFVQGEIFTTHTAMAEMVKLVENSSRDVAIAFANQVAAIAYKAGLNPFELIALANQHPRVSILQPSCGVGGHCIAVDPWFLIETFPEETALLKTSRAVNDEKPVYVRNTIQTAIAQWSKSHTTRCKVVLYGLTYKPNIDDIRESPALHIAQVLSATSNADIYVCEPHLDSSTIAQLTNARSISVERSIEMGDIFIGLVNHTAFKAIPVEQILDKIVLDFCGIWCSSQSTCPDTTHQWSFNAHAMSSLITYTKGMNS